jgi:hypothetical protein
VAAKHSLDGGAFVNAQTMQIHAPNKRHTQNTLEDNTSKHRGCILNSVPREVAAVSHLNAPRPAKLASELPKLATQVPLPHTLHSIGSIVKVSKQLTTNMAAVHTLDGLNVGKDLVVPVHGEELAAGMATEAALNLHRCHFFLAFIVH